MTVGRRIRPAVAVCLLLIVSLPLSAAEYEHDEAFEISQAAIGRELGAHEFRDLRGQRFDLEHLLGKPIVISLIYTSCHHVCPLITRNLAATVGIGREALGADAFHVVTIGFDWQNDTPERMRQYAREQGVRDENWHFLAADASSVRALTETLGFVFYPSSKGFDHLAQTSIIDRNGIVYRQVYGVDIGTQALVEPLKQLVFDTPDSAGLVTHWVDRLKLFCTVYDPNSGRYRFDYSIFLAAFIGIGCLGAVATFVVREWRHSV